MRRAATWELQTLDPLTGIHETSDGSRLECICSVPFNEQRIWSRAIFLTVLLTKMGILDIDKLDCSCYTLYCYFHIKYFYR